MTNPNDPAFPLPDRELGAPIGLTKREMVAAFAVLPVLLKEHIRLTEMEYEQECEDNEAKFDAKTAQAGWDEPDYWSEVVKASLAVADRFFAEFCQDDKPKP